MLKISIKNIDVRQFSETLTFICGLILSIVVYGAFPFIGIPTLGQAIGTTSGFALSLVNQGWLSVYANNFGYPFPAARPFGLLGVLVDSFFLRIGMHPADAYAAMAVVFIVLAYWGAYALSRSMEVNRINAALLATAWVTAPVVWAHSSYSMLSLGLGLLPLYFLSAITLFTRKLEKQSAKIRVAGMYFAACLVAVFMDGYSFMMFAVGSSLLAFWLLVRFSVLHRQLLFYSLPVHFAAFGFAYILYATYVGKSQFEPAPLDFFRSWGADITFYVLPSHGIHWLWDTLGLSIPRSSKEFFGDDSVWITTFSLPLIIVGFIGWWRSRKNNALATGLLIIAIVGFYMSLGPFLKINATRPPEMIVAGEFTQAMPAELTIGPTGSGWISEKLPGFKSMRAAYRWSALGIFGLWGLTVLLLGRSKGPVSCWGTAVVLLLIVSNLPHMGRKWQLDRSYRSQFIQVDKDLMVDIDQIVGEGELVAFLPYRNDLLVNYLASRAGFRTYNIGGDKNLLEAKKHWPYTMQRFRMDLIDVDFVDRILMLLARKEANVVVLSYVAFRPSIDVLGGAYEWPASAHYINDLQPVIQELSRTGFVDIETTNNFAAVRIKQEFSSLLTTGQMEQHLVSQGFMEVGSLSVDNFLPDRIMHQVGYIEKGKLYSNGRSGFLLFGPYHPMYAGDYRLIVRGEVSEGGSAWVDVVSGRGAVSHGKFTLPVANGGNSTLLLDNFLTLDQPAEDIEVRIHVEAEDRLYIDSYELRRVFMEEIFKEETP
jgi:hypothetical protein